MSYWNWLPQVASVAATLYGASQSQKSQEKATTAANKSTEAATQASIQAQREATAAELAKLELAKGVLQTQQKQASPGLVGLQTIIGRGETLTPAQELALSDARRETTNALQGSGLRGSARATAATIQDVEGRMRTGFIDANRNRSDSASSSLASQYFSAGDKTADIYGTQGQRVSQGLVNVGDLNQRNIAQQGQNVTDNILNTGTIKGSAIGNIGAVIADEIKRKSSYEEIDKGSA